MASIKFSFTYLFHFYDSKYELPLLNSICHGIGKWRLLLPFESDEANFSWKSYMNKQSLLL